MAHHRTPARSWAGVRRRRDRSAPKATVPGPKRWRAQPPAAPARSDTRYASTRSTSQQRWNSTLAPLPASGRRLGAQTARVAGLDFADENGLRIVGAPVFGALACL